MVLGTVPRFHVATSGLLLAALGAVPFGCSPEFQGCEASRTCPADTGGSAGEGEGGQDSRGGSTATGGRDGTSDPGDGGEAGDSAQGGSSQGGSSQGGSSQGGSSQGGTGGTTGNAGSDGTPPDGDTTSPHVILVSPTNRSLGVRGDENLVITFSEPMDRLSVEAAYQSIDIHRDDARFSWNSQGTVLTIDPITDMVYAEGTTPNVGAKIHVVTITTLATDIAGNPLHENFVWNFRTLRRITQTMALPTSGVLNASTDGRSSTCFSVGDDAANVGYLTLLSFDIASLPTDVVEFEAATLQGNQSGVTGTPYASGSVQNLGVLRAHHMFVNPPTSASWSRAPLRELGVFSSSAGAGAQSLDVIAGASEDYERRGERLNRSQYRLSFDQRTDNDGSADLANFTCNGFSLVLRYLVP